MKSEYTANRELANTAPIKTSTSRRADTMRLPGTNWPLVAALVAAVALVAVMVAL